MNTYAHMCRDDHMEIGHNDSGREHCVVCRMCDALIAVIAECPHPKLPYSIAVNDIARRALKDAGAENRLYEASLDKREHATYCGLPSNHVGVCTAIITRGLGA